MWDMTRTILSDVRLGAIHTHTAYLSCVDAVLRGAGCWTGSGDELAVLGGIPFQLAARADACPSSVTAYDWGLVHRTALARVGAHSDWYEGGFVSTFEVAQRLAVERMKASIDRGVAVIAWAPGRALEFGVITGYDDADGVFHYLENAPGDPDPVLYDNLGRKDVPWLAYQIVHVTPGEPLSFDRDAARREALEYGVAEWRASCHHGLSSVNSLGPEYPTGDAAYGALIAALDGRETNGFGLGYILWTHADRREMLARWFEAEGLDECARRYAEVRELAHAASALAPFPGVGVLADKVDDARALLTDARAAEEAAVQSVERILAA